MVWKAGTATAGGNPLNDAMGIFSDGHLLGGDGRANPGGGSRSMSIANALAKG
jgi:hypothetical protein